MTDNAQLSNRLISLSCKHTHTPFFIVRHDPTRSFFIPTQLLTHLISNTKVQKKVVLFYTWQSVNLYPTDLKPHKCHQDHCNYKLFQERQQTLQPFWYCFYLWQISQQLVSVRTVHTGSSITTQCWICFAVTVCKYKPTLKFLGTSCFHRVSMCVLYPLYVKPNWMEI